MIQQINKHNLKVGDRLEWVNKLGYTVKFTITRIEEKSVYSNGRESWNTVNNYIDINGAKIIRL